MGNFFLLFLTFKHFSNYEIVFQNFRLRTETTPWLISWRQLDLKTVHKRRRQINRRQVVCSWCHSCRRCHPPPWGSRSRQEPAPTSWQNWIRSLSRLGSHQPREGRRESKIFWSIIMGPREERVKVCILHDVIYGRPLCISYFLFIKIQRKRVCEI